MTLDKISLKQFAQYLAPRPKDCQKGDCGHILIVGGDYGYSGAVRLAGEAALRVGAGLVSVATHQENAFVLNASRPEIMCHGVRTAKDLQPLFEKATVIVLGPGLGKTKWSNALFKATIKSKKPMVVDADGLNLLAENPLKKTNWILTPHPGEASRLLRTSVENIQHDREAAVIRLQKKFGGVSILKGAGSMIAAPDEKPAICEAGNPGMATAGMGDVLSGVIAGLLGQGITTSIAAKLAVCLHAAAGDLAANEGQRGMIASDLFAALRILVNP